MGYWIDKDTFQFDSMDEMIRSIGLDPETLEGDYAEAYHRMSSYWNQSEIDVRFTTGDQKEIS